MAIRSALPWPFRWALVALMLGFSAAIGLWAFEFGKNIAGLDRQSKEELGQLREEVLKLRAESEKNQTRINVSDSLMVAERAEKDNLLAQLKKLELDNQSLKDDLGFFQRLTTANNPDSVSIRGLGGERVGSNQFKWQILVMQSVKNAPEFQGQLELTLVGSKGGKPWTMSVPPGPQTISLKQYKRIEGLVEVPPLASIQSISAKLTQGAAIKAVQTAKIL
jgi:hypothetical protein